MGMGFGGLIATRLIQERNDYFAGAVLVNPCFTMPKKLNAFSQALLKGKALMNPDEVYKFTYHKETQQLLDYLTKKEPLYEF